METGVMHIRLICRHDGLKPQSCMFKFIDWKTDLFCVVSVICYLCFFPPPPPLPSSYL